MNDLVLERAGAILAVVFGARVFAQWRISKRKRLAHKIPLVDPVLLETVFAARTADGDDADTLAEMRDTILHLNRQAFAEEFWDLHEQISSWFETLGQPQRATVCRAVLRLIATSDRWLQLVGAKTAATIGLSDAVPPLHAILNTVQPCPSEDDTQTDPVPEAVQRRFRAELEEALATLSEDAAQSDTI